jgi:hypothetical protein
MYAVWVKERYCDVTVGLKASMFFAISDRLGGLMLIGRSGVYSMYSSTPWPI